MTAPTTPPAPKSDFSATMIGEKVAAAIQRTGGTDGGNGGGNGSRSRFVEDSLAFVGLGQAALYGTAEALASVGWRLGDCKAETGIPWVTIIIFLGCVLPKTVGRATAGKAWEAIANRIGGKS